MLSLAAVREGRFLRLNVVLFHLIDVRGYYRRLLPEAEDLKDHCKSDHYGYNHYPFCDVLIHHASCIGTPMSGNI